MLICFEDAFGNLARNFINKGATLLVNITNDAWFDARAEPQQHLSESVFRAVENRTSVIRCANTGISGLINAKGQIVGLVSDKSLNLTLVSGIKTFDVASRRAFKTFYTRKGDLFVLACLVLFILAGIRLKGQIKRDDR